MQKKKFLTDTIGDDYTTWGDGNLGHVFLKAGTGAGKTFFVINALVPYAVSKGRKICILAPRRILQRDYRGKVEELRLKLGYDKAEFYSLVKVASYQKIENGECGIDLKGAYYVVFDEVHYFLSDATFNARTQLSYEWLLCCLSKVKIYISATGERIADKIIRDKGLQLEKSVQSEATGHLRVCWIRENGFYRSYEVPSDYSSYHVTFIKPRFKVSELLRTLEGKTLILGGGISKLEEMAFELEKDEIKVAMLCRRNYDEEECVVNHITFCEDFHETALLATKVIDTGINIVDYDVKNVVLLCKVYEDFIQLLGRKRLQSGETVNLYVPLESANWFDEQLFKRAEILAEYNKITNCLDIPMELLCKDVSFEKLKPLLYIDKSGKYRVSELGVEQLIYERDFYKKMKLKLQKDENAFQLEVLSWLGKTMDEVEMVEADIKQKYCEKFMALILEHINKPPMFLQDLNDILNKDEMAECVRFFNPNANKIIAQKSFMIAVENSGLRYAIERVPKKNKKDREKYVFKKVDDNMTERGEENE